MGKSYWRGWLQGFADAEGHVDKIVKQLVVSNTDKELLLHFQLGLEVFNIDSKLRGPYRNNYATSNGKPIYRLHIERREAVRRWAKFIGFQNQLKKQALSLLIKSISPKSTLKNY